MWKYFETHFNTLFVYFFTKVIKIWLFLELKLFSNFTGLKYSWAIFYSPKTCNVYLRQQNFTEHLACAKNYTGIYKCQF